MTASIALTDDEWDEALAALAHVTGRLGRLLRSAPAPPDGPVLGHWNAAEVAAHVTQAYERLADMASGWEPPLQDVWELSDLTDRMLAEDPERDLRVLADRVELAGSRFIEVVSSLRRRDPDSMRPWLVAGVEAPLSMVTCHLLNEAVVHGYDVARATRQSWLIEPRHATLILKGFILSLMTRLEPDCLVDAASASEVMVRYDLRLRGGPRFGITLDGGKLSVDEEVRPADCHLSMDPVAFLLVAWNRQSQWLHIATGRFATWGRRPWMAVRLRAYLRNT